LRQLAGVAADQGAQARVLIPVCGAIVGTLNDLTEALAFAAKGKVVASHSNWDCLDNINIISDRTRRPD
jgi:hypothetical protein